MNKNNWIEFAASRLSHCRAVEAYLCRQTGDKPGDNQAATTWTTR